MSVILVEQLLNGLQLGLLLFLISAGLTLIFGVMQFINLSHGSLFMFGAYFSIFFQQLTGNFWAALAATLVSCFALGLVFEIALARRLYARNHLEQILVTFGFILFANDLVLLIWGFEPKFSGIPQILAGHVQLFGGVQYPAYRIGVIVAGVIVAFGLYLFVNKTRIGMLIRAGATNRQMVAMMGVNIKIIYTVVFGVGAILTGLAGALAGPLVSVQAGMGERILIQAFVVIVIGGLGSIKGAFLGAMIVGLIDTLGRAFLRDLLTLVMAPSAAGQAGPAIASMLIYLIMAFVLFFRPQGLLPVKTR